MPLPAKISAGCILALGGIGAVISLVRMKYIGGLAPGPDFFINAIDISLWSITEPGIGITAASLATLRPLFRCCMANARSAFTGSNASAPKKASNSTSQSASGGYGRNSPAPHKAIDFQDRGIESSSRPPLYEVQTTVIGNARVMDKMGVARETVQQQPLPRSETEFEQVPSTASRRMRRLSASIANIGNLASRKAPNIPTRTPSQRPLVANEQGVKMAKLKRRDDGKFEVVNPTAEDREGDWL